MTASSIHPDCSTARSLPQDSLRSLFFQIEAELHRSAAFRQAQASQTGSPEGQQALLKAVGREAIRLAMRQMVRGFSPKPASSSASAANPPARLELLAAPPSAIGSGSAKLAAPKPISAEQPTRSKEITPCVAARAAAATPAFEQQRTDILQQIGEALRQARQAKALSIEQVYSQTWIPVYQLKALEAGQVDQLPEDIYVRGFIQRAGDALGLNGRELAASLPTSAAAKSVVPSWARSQRSTGSFSTACLEPVHLYVGYAALMAGAVGSLAWITQHPITPGLLQHTPPDTDSQAPELQIRPGVRFSQSATRAVSAQAVAQPESTLNSP